MQKKEERSWVLLENQNQKIFGVLHTPLPIKRSPVVVMCHGLAGNKSGKYRLYATLAQALAHLGIAVLRFDFRGAGDSEGEFSDMTIESQVSDALLCLNWVKEQPHIDPERIGLFGRSFGGAIGIQAARQFGKIKSLALWAPVFDGDQWKDRWKIAHSPDASRDQIEQFMCINGQVGSFALFEQLFQLQIADALASLQHIPLLHIHGQKDKTLTIEHAIQYEKFRQGAEADTKFLRLPNSDHDFTYLPERKTAIIETLKWFTDTLEVTHAQPTAKISHGLSGEAAQGA